MTPVASRTGTEADGVCLKLTYISKLHLPRQTLQVHPNPSTTTQKSTRRQNALQSRIHRRKSSTKDSRICTAPCVYIHPRIDPHIDQTPTLKVTQQLRLPSLGLI